MAYTGACFNGVEETKKYETKSDKNKEEMAEIGQTEGTIIVSRRQSHTNQLCSRCHSNLHDVTISYPSRDYQQIRQSQKDVPTAGE